MKAWVFGEEPSGGGMSGAPSQQAAGAGSPGLPMLPEQPDCGAPCALCESLAHLLAQAREENAALRAKLERADMALDTAEAHIDESEANELALQEIKEARAQARAELAKGGRT